MIGADPEVHADSSPFVTVRLLQAISRFVETRGWGRVRGSFLVPAGGSAWGGFRFLVILITTSYTLSYIAQAPTLSQLLALTRHRRSPSPPLLPSHPCLVRDLRSKVHGPAACLQCSPFLFTVALVFWLANVSCPLFTESCPFCSSGASRSATRRTKHAHTPLLLCFTALMLVSWYRATEAPNSNFTSYDRRFALLTLTIGGFGLLLSHVLGVLPYAAFLAAGASSGSRFAP